MVNFYPKQGGLMNKLVMIKEVRERTGIGLAEAKRAVEAVDMRSIDEAIEFARTNGWKPRVQENTRSRVGIVKTYNHNDRIAAMVELLCDTDFVAKSNDFQDLAHTLLLQIVGTNPVTVEELLCQPFVRDPAVTVRQLVEATQAAVKERVQINRFVRWEIPHAY